MPVPLDRMVREYVSEKVMLKEYYIKRPERREKGNTCGYLKEGCPMKREQQV